MKNRLPIFEIFISLLSCWLAATLFFNPTMFESNPQTFGKMDNVLEEWSLALMFFVAAMIKIVGVLLNVTSLRIIGLCFSAVIYLTIAVIYAATGAWWGMGNFALLFLFSLASVYDINNTKL